MLYYIICFIFLLYKYIILLYFTMYNILLFLLCCLSVDNLGRILYKDKNINKILYNDGDNVYLSSDMDYKGLVIRVLDTGQVEFWNGKKRMGSVDGNIVFGSGTQYNILMEGGMHKIEKDGKCVTYKERRLVMERCVAYDKHQQFKISVIDGDNNDINDGNDKTNVDNNDIDDGKSNINGKNDKNNIDGKNNINDDMEVIDGGIKDSHVTVNSTVILTEFKTMLSTVVKTKTKTETLRETYRIIKTVTIEVKHPKSVDNIEKIVNVTTKNKNKDDKDIKDDKENKDIRESKNVKPPAIKTSKNRINNKYKYKNIIKKDKNIIKRFKQNRNIEKVKKKDNKYIKDSSIKDYNNKYITDSAIKDYNNKYKLQENDNKQKNNYKKPSNDINNTTNQLKTNNINLQKYNNIEEDLSNSDTQENNNPDEDNPVLKTNTSLLDNPFIKSFKDSVNRVKNIIKKKYKRDESGIKQFNHLIDTFTDVPKKTNEQLNNLKNIQPLNNSAINTQSLNNPNNFNDKVTNNSKNTEPLNNSDINVQPFNNPIYSGNVNIQPLNNSENIQPLNNPNINTLPLNNYNNPNNVNIQPLNNYNPLENYSKYNNKNIIKNITPLNNNINYEYDQPCDINMALNKIGVNTPQDMSPFIEQLVQ
ncbi:hypothetical protein SLOPH_472 [Spraguea lophii 42_110]|uniref:Uncharacterized protein n=1 Tax=Spraguea lophii (strain 42_110) TaxID=1358809 RepID=S7XLF3_SPRLO|nr:hypothetical protein SLOPH_472 [Spraguea lophii 42_110]